jgi:hypothetical protein
MISELTQAMIVNGVVLAAVLEADLGPARKIGRFRILRPVLTSAAVIPLFAVRPQTHGTGLVIELAAIVAGLLGGLAATSLMGVYRSPKTGKPVSRAGVPYAALWTVIVGARAAFSYGSVHWFHAQIVSWAVANQVTTAAITDGLISMAIAMVLVRTVGLYVRATRLPVSAPSAQNAALAAH